MRPIIKLGLRRGDTTSVTTTAERHVAPPTSDAGFVSLFNGKDLTGWKPLPEQPGTWQVIDGILVGSNGPGHLYSAATTTRTSTSGLRWRSTGAAIRGAMPTSISGRRCSHRGRPASITQTEARPATRPKSLGGPAPRLAPFTSVTQRTGADAVQPARTAVKPDEWFTLEVIADGNHLVTKVNGSSPVDLVDPLSAIRRATLPCKSGGRPTYSRCARSRSKNCLRPSL